MINLTTVGSGSEQSQFHVTAVRNDIPGEAPAHLLDVFSVCLSGQGG